MAIERAPTGSAGARTWGDHFSMGDLGLSRSFHIHRKSATTASFASWQFVVQYGRLALQVGRIAATRRTIGQDIDMGLARARRTAVTLAAGSVLVTVASGGVLAAAAGSAAAGNAAERAAESITTEDVIAFGHAEEEQ